MIQQPITIGFNVDDTPASIVAFLTRIQGVMLAIDTDSQDIPAIDLSQCRYFGPDMSALLGALILDAARTNRRLRVELPKIKPALLAYAGYCGLKHLLGDGPPPDSDHPASETLPISTLFGVPGLTSDRIVRLIRRHTEFGDEDAEYLRIAFNELAQNVDDHAKSPVGTVFCAKYFHKAHEVRVAVVDRGATIPEVLWRRYPDHKPADQALRVVLQGGFSSKSRENNMGQGIRNIKEMVDHRKGRLCIVSRDAVLECSHDRASRAWLPRGLWFQGTAVFFTMRLGIPSE